MKTRCSFPLDEVFKDMVRQERLNPDVQALQWCDAMEKFEQVQKRLRDYLKTKYPTFFKIRYSDMFDFLIALIYPHLEKCEVWSDVKFVCTEEYTNFDLSFGNMQTTCVCGHRTSPNNTYVVKHPDGHLKLALGCCCIEKSEIVNDFELVQKRRKEYLKKLEKQHVKKWTDYNHELLGLHRARIQQIWNDYNEKLMHMHRTRTHTSCQHCKKKVQCPYHICFGCRQTEYDKCRCGKSKKKEYPKCYTCKSSP